jgi:prefoldin subunit 5
MSIDIKTIMQKHITELDNKINELTKQIEALKREIFTKGLKEDELILQDKKTIHYYVALFTQYLNTLETLRKWINDYRESGFMTEEEIKMEQAKLEELRQFLENTLSRVKNK